MTVLLQGTVGSTAYGLAGPDSDIDQLGMFAADTINLVGLHPRDESIVTTHPDLTLHEAAKFARLALSCNPTVSELMWLPDDLYSIRTHLGDDLIHIRRAFLSQKRVRDAYLGYAHQQFTRLEGRGDGSFSADTRKRTAKHARHLLRLCHQGLLLYATGHLEIRLEEPERFHEFGAIVGAGNIEHARRALADFDEAFTNTTPAIPAAPNEPLVAGWLRSVRIDRWRL